MCILLDCIYIMEHYSNDLDRGKLSTVWKTRPRDTTATTNVTRDWAAEPLQDRKDEDKKKKKSMEL